MAGKFALIIRNSHYEDSSLGRLTASDVDVQALEAVLKAPDVGQFDEVTTLLNEGCATVRKAIARFYDQRQRDDLLFLYFSGQGVKDEKGHLYLALRDTESGLLAGSAIETAFITGRMDRSFSKRQVLVLDCCHSGAFAHGAKSAQGVSVGTAEAFEGTGLGRVVLTATDSTQYAWEGDQVIGDAQNSLFTHFLVEGLKTGAADTDADGVVTVDELYDYVRKNVVTTTPLQTPYKWSYLQRGAIVLAQNPFAKRSGLPAEIEEAVNSKLSGLRLEAVGHLEELLHGHHAGRAHAALEALKALSQDDSRKVANAATQALKTHDEETGREPSDEETGREPSEQPPGEEAPADDRDPGRPSDIFISYAHEDQAKARALANALVTRGWKVWWDRKIAPGEAYDVTIEQELGTCKCAIVLWSNTSVHATWVRNEARRAARRKVLLPILIDAVEMPLEFENLQAADLTSWQEASEHPELEAVLDRVLALSPIPNESLAREAVEQARRDVKAGRRKAALTRLEQFRPAHYMVSRALAELRAEGEKLERERAEASRREAEAARVECVETERREAEAARINLERVEAEQRQAEAARLEQERVETERRRAEAARIERERLKAERWRADAELIERERAETERRQAEAARIERERVETERREAEAARVERERLETARRNAGAAGVQRHGEAAERLASETQIKRQHARAAEDPSFEQEEHPELEAVFERVQALSPIPHRRVDEDVQFSVYRPTLVVPQRWYPMLTFAHLVKPRPDAAVEEPDPVAEVERQAEQILGDAAAQFSRVSMDSRQPIPFEGHLRIVPTVPGVQFNPPERSFLWLEPVHREEFHLRAGLDMDGQTARGSVGVYLDWLLIADIAIAISVDSHARETARPVPDIARPYRRIFASYSHRDAAVVKQFEDYARGFGDRYMRDVIDLRAGEEWDTRLTELIESADVFQLFWSWNSMGSPFVRSEWEHALKVNRAHFIRPVYWEQPFPERGDLPPAALRTLHFAHVGSSLGGVQSPSVQAPYETPPADTLQRGAETEPKPPEAKLLAKPETRRADEERIRQQDAARRAALEEGSSERLHAEAQQAQERARREYAERRATEEETLKRRAQAEAERAAERRIAQEDAARRATAEEDELKRRLKLESRRAAEENELRHERYPDRTSAPKLKAVPIPTPSPSPAPAAPRSPRSLRSAWWAAASILIFAALLTIVLMKSC